MFYDQIYRPLIALMQDYPEQSCGFFGYETFNFGLLAQRIAPIMDEMDALADNPIALLLEPELQNYAAVWACWLCGKTLLPLSKNLTEPQRNQLQHTLGFSKLFTAEKMFYFYRKTYSDALCRIDNGLPIDDESWPALMTCSFDSSGAALCNKTSFQELSERLLLLNSSIGHDIFPDLIPFVRPIMMAVNNLPHQH